MSRHFFSGRCTLIAICFGILAMTAPWPRRAFGSSGFCGQGTTPSQSGQPVLRSEVDLQTVNVHVKDKQGNNLPGLSAHDFTVRENGEAEEIAFFDVGNEPVTVAVLVDSSSSMVRGGPLGSAEEIAARFMRIARPGDEIWAMDFTEWTGPFKQIKREEVSNRDPLAAPGAVGSGSAVYDAIATAICHLRSSSNWRQAIIVITDGIDEHSRLSLDQLIDVVRSQRAQLFLIGLPSRPEFRFGHIEPKVTLVSGHDIDNPNVVFYRLAKEAGAETFIPKSKDGLQDALNAVSNLLESEYALAYYPPKTSHKLRKIEVKVDRRGVRVLTSRFVVANPGAAELVHYAEGTCLVSPQFHLHPYDPHVTYSPSGIVYRDDFSDRSSGWPQHPNSHYRSGGYELSTTVEPTPVDTPPLSRSGDLPISVSSATVAATYREHVVAAYGPPWRDFRMSAGMKAVFERPPRSDTHSQFSEHVHPAAGLVFRVNEKGCYALLVSPSAAHNKKLAFEVVAITFQGDLFAESVVLPWTTVDLASPTEAQLAVQSIADQITIFVDGQQVGAAHDRRFTDGYVGFMVAAPAQAIFTNLLVEER